jgi:hypothetical protein
MSGSGTKGSPAADVVGCEGVVVRSSYKLRTRCRTMNGATGRLDALDAESSDIVFQPPAQTSHFLVLTCIQFYLRLWTMTQIVELMERGQ